VLADAGMLVADAGAPTSDEVVYVPPAASFLICVV
jgi:hypothetical protein